MYKVSNPFAKIKIECLVTVGLTMGWMLFIIDDKNGNQLDTGDGVKLVYKCRTNDGHGENLCYLLCHNDSLNVSLFVDS
jgi:hypothetical protein